MTICIIITMLACILVVLEGNKITKMDKEIKEKNKQIENLQSRNKSILADNVIMSKNLETLNKKIVELSKFESEKLLEEEPKKKTTRKTTTKKTTTKKTKKEV